MKSEIKVFVDAYTKTRIKRNIKVFNFNPIKNEKTNPKVSSKTNK